ncbi:cystathionine gamma-synthase [Streptococcus sp. SO4]|uniref:cystathionine gamma-synthase n=1 Tax=Streptococcus sp. SO4 TaxID=3018249 RepID=UPI00263D72DB|nr:cystathionine gamma-synthase [Streptococcus sp. SO4]MDN5025588.1 cystathionine gamma-synthase [Streptococcus sp. SO4]
MTQKRFPIVADDEVMLTEMPVMNLYDESDFISNIKGDYQDKNYLEWSPITEEKKQEKAKPLVKSIEKKEKSYAELAREEARADLKKKRSARYLTQDVSHTRRQTKTSQVRPANQPTAPFQKENPGEFAKYSQKLGQSHYILAETVSQVEHPISDGETSRSKKNNYDFLKKSQIYNKKSKQKEQEHQVAQELNLTRMSE